MCPYFSGRAHPLPMRANLRVVTAAPTTLTDAGTWYPIAGTFADGDCDCFTVESDGKMTYVGGNGRSFLFSGDSDLEVNKACRITYGLEKNGTPNGEIITPRDFVSASKIGGVGICRNLILNNGDVFYVRVQSTEANTSVTVNTLYLIFRE